MGVALMAVTVHLVPGSAQWLQYDRQAVLAGAWWRCLTGHLVHWNTEHLVWDLLMFVVLGYLIERQSRWPAVVALARVGGCHFQLRLDCAT